MSRPRKLFDIISERGSALGELARRAADMDRLGRTVASLLPDPVGSHVTSASLHDDVLVVITDSPAWASRVRFEGNSLLEGIRAAGADAQKLVVKVRGGHS
ncbi:MAG: DciA family protein [Gammaproteobacteria bacterium]